MLERVEDRDRRLDHRPELGVVGGAGLLEGGDELLRPRRRC